VHSRRSASGPGGCRRPSPLRGAGRGARETDATSSIGSCPSGGTRLEYTAHFPRSARNLPESNLAVAHSKRFGPFDNFFIAPEAWGARRAAFFQRAGLPARPDEVGAYLTQRLGRAYDAFLAAQHGNTYATVTDQG
jgi:hypothetical protein